MHFPSIKEKKGGRGVVNTTFIMSKEVSTGLIKTAISLDIFMCVLFKDFSLIFLLSHEIFFFHFYSKLFLTLIRPIKCTITKLKATMKT